MDAPPQAQLMGRTLRLHRPDNTVQMAPVRLPEQPEPPPMAAAPVPEPEQPAPALPIENMEMPKPEPEPIKRRGLFHLKKTAKPKPAKPDTPAEPDSDARAAEAAKLRKGYLALARRVVLVAAMFWVLFGVVFMLARVQGNEMFPAVKDGDLVLAYRLQQSCTKNDVVIYQADGITHVGRVLATGGDVVNITEDGTLQVNGTTQSGEILYPTYPVAAAGLSYPYKVPDGSVFILADYRTNAADSRNFGAIPMRDVKGTVQALLRRRGL